MWNLFDDIWPDNDREVIIQWSDQTEDECLWFRVMGNSMDWWRQPRPVAWKYKENKHAK